MNSPLIILYGSVIIGTLAYIALTLVGISKQLASRRPLTPHLQGSLLMTQDQITSHFVELRRLADKLAGADLPEGEKKMAQYAVDSILQIIESVVLDINHIANALERSN